MPPRLFIKMKAQFVKTMQGWTGDAALYQLDPSMHTTQQTVRFVVASATVAPMSGPETYLFAADAEGNITSWIELDGSFKGGLSHQKALGNAGYSIAEAK